MLSQQKDNFTLSGQDEKGHRCLKSVIVIAWGPDTFYYEGTVTAAVGDRSVIFNSPGAGKLHTFRWRMRCVKKFSSAITKFGHYS
jgi:hypothetical protein